LIDRSIEFANNLEQRSLGEVVYVRRRGVGNLARGLVSIR